MSITVERYTPDCAREWDELVNASRNGTFLLQRGFMDYHSDRFADFSLMMRDSRGHLIAVMPANRVADDLYSHQGLTYGGWICSASKPDGNGMLEGWEQMTGILREAGIRRLHYRPVPHIYHRYPCEEDLYALFRNGGKLERMLLSSALPLLSPLPFNENSRRALRRAEKAGVKVIETDDFRGFWKILVSLLSERYDTAPVHTLEEMNMLKRRFPNEISLYVTETNGMITAGTVVFRTPQVWHTQYIATTEEGRSNGSLAMLFSRLINDAAPLTRYLDFGTSNEDAGRILNATLLQQKAGFGARGVTYPAFVVEI